MPEEALYDPPKDADGLSPWVTFSATDGEPGQRLIALSALLSAAKISFKIVYGEYGSTANFHVGTQDRKALEILLSLASLVKVDAPPALRITVPQNLGTEVETVPQEVEPVPNRFDEI